MVYNMKDVKKIFVIVLLLTGLLFTVTVATVNIVLPMFTDMPKMVFATDGGLETTGYGDEFEFPWVPG